MATRAVSITNNFTNFSRLWHGLEQTATLSKPIQNGIVSQIKQAFIFRDFEIACNITATQHFGQDKSLGNFIKRARNRKNIEKTGQLSLFLLACAQFSRSVIVF